ncbi:MAG TPA: 50S ribosomal protein L22 [bacterium]|nr:50S ribosomal protein L22 [bacterium]
MEARAVAKYVRISPLKVRQVTAMIAGRPVTEAQAVLRFAPSRSAQAVAKVLNSAVANAENNYELNRDDLIVSRAVVDKGPSTKRLQTRARGRADVIIKRSSHITVVVAEKE